MSSSSKQRGSGKKRESQPGPRNVSTMSAEKLERKRAHDREAQRSIRQRTKENIEQLENENANLRSQVAEMQPLYDRYEELLQQNVALEEEVRGLKRQLAAFTERRSIQAIGQHFNAFPDNFGVQGGPGTGGNAGPSVPSTNTIHSHFPDLPHTSGLPRAPDTNAIYPLRASDWPPYTSPRSRSLGCSDQETSNRIESYVMDGQLPQSPRLAPPSLCRRSSDQLWGIN
ncbi:hypothetical protein N7486_003208 [Penicillium sp. IBT 16267x]|nr:hypothetical protein N7486_003208 [Penicillium sp. IBT 16267x]